MSGGSGGQLLCKGRWAMGGARHQARWEQRPHQEAAGCGAACLVHDQGQRQWSGSDIVWWSDSKSEMMRQVQDETRKPSQQVWVRIRGDRRPGVDVAAAQLRCSTGEVQQYSRSVKAVPKGKERKALMFSFLHNRSYQQSSWPWTQTAEL